MSIEQHYEKLRQAAAAAKENVDLAEKIAAGESVDLSGKRLLRLHMIDELNAQAIDYWPADRAAIAAAGGQMPDGPLRFRESGYGIAGLISVCSDRLPVDRELAIASRVVQAAQAILPELTRYADMQVSAFEAYRQAVAQGVAVAPSDD